MIRQKKGGKNYEWKTKKLALAGDCKIRSVTKIVTNSEEINGNYKVSYTLEFTKNGEDDATHGIIETPNANEETVKIAVAKECDKIWLELKSEAETIDINPIN